MGFKELQKFNDAMLAKQVWRLLEDKISLFHKFFKAKFFPKGNIFDAKENKGSFAWRSILKSRDVISKGAQWRVGNGEDILIFKDSWLPNLQQSKVQSFPTFLGTDVHVSVLIDKENRTWISDAIVNNFLPHEAMLIESIPISIVEAKDKLFWPSNSDGLYSVKAGYRLLVNESLNPPDGHSLLSQPMKYWKVLWKLKIPNRTKTLLWRATKDALPTRANLMRRKVLMDSTCQGCETEPKSTLHALWSCLKLKEVWAVHFESLKIRTHVCLSFLDVFITCLEQPHNTALFAMLIDQIWYRRNKLRLGEEAADLKLLNSRARAALHEFQLANTSPPKPPPVQTPIKWKPPPSEWVKINFDGAVFKEQA